MPRPKSDRRRKSASKDEKHEPLEIEVRFCAPTPPPLGFPGAEVAPQPAKKTDGPERPPLIFRF